jgi:type I restriction-modification system DNA methylase subunit
LSDSTNPLSHAQISQEEINAILWRACDTFRGTVDPSEYKNYILVMLFLKYISDVWQDHDAQYRMQLELPPVSWSGERGRRYTLRKQRETRRWQRKQQSTQNPDSIAASSN